jgi:hypothetical protein
MDYTELIKQALEVKEPYKAAVLLTTGTYKTQGFERLGMALNFVRKRASKGYATQGIVIARDSAMLINPLTLTWETVTLR